MSDRFWLRVRNEFDEIKTQVLLDKNLYYLIFFLSSLSLCFAYINGYTSKLSLFAYFYTLKLLVPISIIIYLVFYFFKLLYCREKRPIRRYVELFSVAYFFRARIISAFVLLTAISVFMSSFSTMKSLIPIVNMFHFDELLHRVDLWLFFGEQPGLLLINFLDNPFFLMAINLSYNLWFFLIWGAVLYFLLAEKTVVRQRFFITWLLCWSVIGVIFAMLLSSAGPAFLEKLDPSNHTYFDLMQVLRSYDSWLVEKDWPGIYALSTQERLWDAHSERLEMLGSGISAMPSMHVSMAVLIALSLGRLNKLLNVVLWLYVVIIYIGSFTLGWHYAVDGLVSAPLTCLLWRLSYFVERQYYQRPQSLQSEIDV